MALKKHSFDGLFLWFVLKIPYFGEPLKNYYLQHGWFRRFTQFTVYTTGVYWFVRAPMIVVFTLVLPETFLWIFPGYLLATFITGIIVTIIGFVINDKSVWKNRGD